MKISFALAALAAFSACTGAAPTSEDSGRRVSQDQPQPSASPLSAVQTLAAAGITVTTQPQTYPPGQPTFDVRLAQFWDVLSLECEELLARRALFNQIRVAGFTSYSSANQLLNLGVDFSADDVRAYLGLLDRRAQFEKSTGLTLDPGIDFYGFETGDRLFAARERIEFFEQNVALFQGLRGVVKTVSLNGTSGYTLNDRTLRINRDTYFSEVPRLAPMLEPMGGFFSWADGIGLSINTDGSSPDTTDPQKLAAFIATLDAQRSALTELQSLAQLTSIAIGGVAQSLSFEGQTLLVTLNADKNNRVILALLDVYRMSAQLAVPIGVSSMGNLDGTFAHCVERLSAAFAEIKAKAAAISAIQFGPGSSYSPIDHTLTIGFADSDAQYAAVLKSIP